LQIAAGAGEGLGGDGRARPTRRDHTLNGRFDGGSSFVRRKSGSRSIILGLDYGRLDLRGQIADLVLYRDNRRRQRHGGSRKDCARGKGSCRQDKQSTHIRHSIPDLTRD
jgi:hypothetical protein